MALPLRTEKSNYRLVKLLSAMAVLCCTRRENNGVDSGEATIRNEGSRALGRSIQNKRLSYAGTAGMTILIRECVSDYAVTDRAE